MLKNLFVRFITTQSTRGQIARYLVAGGSAVVVDFILYRLIMWVFDVKLLAKAVGYVGGTVYSFFINRSFTFKRDSSTRKQVIAYLAIYVVSMFLNTGINQLGLKTLGTGEIGINVSFATAAVTSAAFNFICMKLFVFKRPSPMNVGSQ
jgi:putative flippase GtrA